MTMGDYRAFLNGKAMSPLTCGYQDDPPAHPAMFPHQRDTFDVAIRIGRFATFLDTGLGKALVALHWADTVSRRENAPVLIFAPLAVAHQFVREGEKFGIDCSYAKNRDALTSGVNVTNYDRLDQFSPDDVVGVVLDESSILKALTGATKRALTDFADGLRFRLCCTATPSPNDFMELGNHAEFLGVMSTNEMLSRFFINDTSTASQTWRLKGHAQEAFWDWIATWSIGVTKPSDLGYPDEGFDLPRLDVIKHVVDVDITRDRGDALFRMAAVGSMDLHREKRLTLTERVAKVAEVVGGQPDERWLIWCHANVEADALSEALPRSVEVRGSMSAEVKERRILDFVEERSHMLVTKPRIAGWGLNLQNCARMIFVGVNFSYEEMYQTIRRCWRFGQIRVVECHVVLAPTEAGVWDTVMRKQSQHDVMKVGLMAAMKRAHGSGARRMTEYKPQHQGRLPAWLLAG